MTSNYVADIKSKSKRSSSFSKSIQKGPYDVKINQSTKQIFSFMHDLFNVATLSHTYGRSKTKAPVGKDYFVYSSPDDQSGLIENNKMLKARNLVVCLTGHGKNPAKAVNCLKLAMYYKIGKLLDKVTSHKDALVMLKEIMDELQKACIEGDSDYLYSGASVTVSFVLGDQLYYSNIGINKIVAIVRQDGFSQLTMMDKHVHSLDNAKERERLLASNSDASLITVDKGFQLVVDGSPVLDIVFPATRCFGMMAGFSRGIKDKPGKINLARLWFYKFERV